MLWLEEKDSKRDRVERVIGSEGIRACWKCLATLEIEFKLGREGMYTLSHDASTLSSLSARLVSSLYSAS